MEKEIQIRKDNPLFAKPVQESHSEYPENQFFADVPTSSDFMNEWGARYAEKQRSHAENSLVKTLSKMQSTPNQKKVERSLIESWAHPDDVEAYMRYRNAPREKILEPTKTLSAFLDLLPEDVPILEDFLLMAHRNNVGYAFTVPKADWRSSSAYFLDTPC